MPGSAARGLFSVTCYRDDGAVRLLCFPVAGAAGSVFAPWQESLPPEIEVCAIEMPMGELVRQPLDMDLTRFFDEIIAALRPNLDKPLVLFGHSMGALVAFEIACRLRSELSAEPLRVFAAACRSPSLMPSGKRQHLLSDEGLERALLEMGGTPQSILEDEEYRGPILEIVRSDFAMLETYRYARQPPLSCPISILGGLQDDETDDALIAGWREETTGPVVTHRFPGGHFFYNDSREAVLETLARETLAAQAARS